MNRCVGDFDPILKNINENEQKIQKKELLQHGVILYVLVSRKNDKLDF